MRILFAGEGDTLRKISRNKAVGVDELISLNSHITDPDLMIAGYKIHLPPIMPEIEEDYLEHWIPLTSLEEMGKKDYDVLIVGSGAGGGAALWRLCHKWGSSKQIGIVEAGSAVLPTHAYNIPTLGNERWRQYFLNPRISRTAPDYASIEVIALGGRTLFWLAVSPRMHVSEIVKWPVPIKEMEMYYNIAEKIMNVTQDFTRGSAITQLSLDRLQEGGFPDATDQPIATDLEPTMYGELHSNVFFSSLSFFADALNQRPFDLAVNSPAVQVAVENGKVSGVIVMSPDKKPRFIKAKNVILSASTFQTPRILLNSGIQGRAIGHYLTNHSRVYGKGIVNRREFPEVLGTLGILVPGREDRPYQIQIIGPGSYMWYHHENKPLKDEWEVYYHASGKVESRYENRVTLDPNRRDEYGVPKLQVHFSYSEKDEAVIALEKAAVMQVSTAMKAPLVETKAEPAVTLWPPGKELHEMGTCRMGDDHSTSATNRYGQIHNVSGLYVADNSVIPTSGTANPTLTTVALAIRTADYIIQQQK